MTATTTTRFGRRGAAPAKTPVRFDAAPRSDAAAAFEMATRWGSAPAEPTLRSITAPLPAQDVWTPASDLAAPARAVAPPPSLLALLFSTQGRIRRRDYWVVSTLAWLLAVLGLVVLFIDLPLMQAAGAAVVLLLVYSRVRACLTIKRWHDRDKSGAWVWISMLPAIGWLWALTECGFLEGTPGDNRYGPPPK